MRMIKISYYCNLYMFILFFTSGCGLSIPIKDVDLPLAKDRLNFNVKLLITDDFRKGRFDGHKKNSFLLSIGENLAHNSKRLMMNAFKNPVIPEKHDDPINLVLSDYVMRPELEVFEGTQGGATGAIVQTTIGVRWFLSDKLGNPIWVKVVKGTATSAVTEEEMPRVEMALQDLFQNTQNEILSSKLLRELE